jgi:hypothetical protein
MPTKPWALIKKPGLPKPADLMNESNSADISSIIEEAVVPGAEGEDVGVGCF